MSATPFSKPAIVAGLVCLAVVIVPSAVLSAQSASLLQNPSGESISVETQARLDQLEAQVRQLQMTSSPTSLSGNSPLFIDSEIQQAGHEVYRCTDVESCLSCSSNRFPEVAVTGFLHADLVHFNQDQANQDLLGNLENGVDIRRARVGFKGKVTEDISYIMEFDFGEAIPLFVDNWVNFSNIPGVGNLRIGRWRQPFGMSELTSIRDLPFLERSTGFTFTPFRQTGIGIFNHSEDERATWALSGYRFPSDNFGSNVGDSGGWGLAGRLTVLALDQQDDGRLIHLGASYAFHDPSDDILRFATQPEIQVTESTGGALPSPLDGVPPFVDSGVLAAQNSNHLSLEAAGQLGDLYLQSEARWVVVKMLNGTSETFPAAYAQARYLLTGERLPYNKTAGVFGNVVPCEEFSFSSGGLGAWELAARWSYIDLNGGDITGPGRRLNDVTVGMNWYLNRFTKFQFNYIRAMLDDPATGNSHADIFAARTQIAF